MCINKSRQEQEQKFLVLVLIIQQEKLYCDLDTIYV